MTNKRNALLVFALLIFLIIPAQAALVDITILFNNRPTTDVQPIRVQVPDLSSYIFTQSGKSITLETFYLPTGIEGQTIYFTLTRNSNSISGTIKKESTGSFTGNEIISFDGGTSRTISYTKIPCVGTCQGGNTILFDTAPSITIAYALENATSNAYLIGVPTSELTGFSNSISSMTTVLATGTLDTTTDAYISLSEPLSTNPVYSLLYSCTGSLVGADIWYESIQSTRQNEISVASGKLPINQDASAIQVSILSAILDAILAIAKFVKDIGTYVIAVGGIAILVLGGQVFLTIVGAYTIIAAILSVHDSDNMFKSIGKFIRYELKLWRMFMELFLWMKDLIKWW